MNRSHCLLMAVLLCLAPILVGCNPDIISMSEQTSAVTEQTTEVTLPLPEYPKELYGDYAPVYAQLTAREYSVYCELLEGIRAHDEIVELSGSADKDELYRAYEALLVSPEANMLFVPRSYTYTYSAFSGDILSVSLKYSFGANEMLFMNSEIEARTKEIMAGVTDSMSIVDKLRYFHDTIITGCDYSVESEYRDTIYGCLVKGEAVCEGFARSMQHLCEQAGIPCIMITGWAQEEHIWNMVRIDEKWYHLDVTWDAKRFVADAASYVGYSYFNITTEEILRSHKITENLFEIPEADSTVANFFAYYNCFADSVDNVAPAFRRAIIAEASALRTCAYVRLPDAATLEAATALLRENEWQGVIALVDEANEQLERRIRRDSLQINFDNDFCIIELYYQLEEPAPAES